MHHFGEGYGLRETVPVTMCFFVLRNLHWFNRVLGSSLPIGHDRHDFKYR